MNCLRTKHNADATVKVLLQITRCLFVCLPDSDDSETVLSSTTTSTSSVSCSPRWIVYPNAGAEGAQRVSEAKTMQLCLDACVANSSCVAVDWNNLSNDPSYSCWIHKTNHQPSPRGDAVTHFKIVRRCYTESST